MVGFKTLLHPESFIEYDGRYLRMSRIACVPENLRQRDVTPVELASIVDPYPMHERIRAGHDAGVGWERDGDRRGAFDEPCPLGS